MTIRELEAASALAAAAAGLVAGGALLVAGFPGPAAGAVGAIYLVWGLYVATIQGRARAVSGVVHDERDLLLERRAFRAATWAGLIAMALFVLAMLALHAATLSVPIGWLAAGLVLQLLVGQSGWAVAILAGSRGRWGAHGG